MKKIAAVMLAILMLFVAVSCVDTGNGTESSAPESSESLGGDKENSDLPYVLELSETDKYMIETDWKEFKGEDIVWFNADADELDYEAARYYGIFGDNCHVLFYHEGWNLDFACAVSVADEEFTHDELFEIYLYKNGFFYEIGEAYEKEMIELPEVMILADIHAEFENYIKASK